MNVANKLTLVRIGLVPVFIAFFYIDVPYWNYWAALVFVAASLTDLFDGLIARKHGLVTNFGKLVDPIADKLLVCSALIMLLAKFEFAEHWFSDVFVLLVIVMVGREFVISGLRLLAAAGGKVLAADSFGKAKTIVQIVAVVALLLRGGLFFGTFFEGWLAAAGIVLMCAATLLSVISCISYFTKNSDVLADLVKHK